MIKKFLSIFNSKFIKIKMLILMVFLMPLIFFKPTLASITYIPEFDENIDTYSQISEYNVISSEVDKFLEQKLDLDFVNVDNTEYINEIDAKFEPVVEVIYTSNLAKINDEMTQDFGNGNNSPERIVDPTKPMVALTFDDGPHSTYTNNILDTLNKYNSKATFFIVGNRAISHENEIRRIINDGHEIGNHTYEHLNLTKNKQEVVEKDVYSVDELIESYVGFTPNLLRPPGGKFNNEVLNTFDKSIILWNIDTLDWEIRDTDTIISSVVDNVKDGDVVLLHDIYETTSEAVVDIVPTLIDKGFQIVTISELAEHRGGLENNNHYRNFSK